jgi:macrolide transport system ATP-binding/permease protein
MTDRALLDIRSLTKTYVMGDQTLRALDNVDLTIAPGDFVAIVGPSGSGKSTLMHMIGLLDSWDEGDIFIDGVNVRGMSESDVALLRSQKIGFVFQQFHLLNRNDAFRNVALPLMYARKPLDKSHVEDLLNQVGLKNRMNHKPNELSGGQQQRVAIARALVNRPSLILADEPTGNLDSQSEKEILDLLVHLNSIGMTVVIVTHEEEVTKIAHRVVKMRDGKIVSDIRSRPIPSLPTKNASSEVVSNTSPKAYSWTILKNFAIEALKAVFGSKMRSMLSVLGVMIGVAAVIAMLGLGAGAKQSMEEQLSNLGSNILVVFPASSRPSVTGVSTNIQLTLDDLEALQRDLPNVKGVSGRVDTRGSRSTVQFGEKTWNPTITGVSAAYVSMRNFQPEKGRSFTEEENKARARVALIGVTVVSKLFGENINPIGEKIKINRVFFDVIGVLPEKGATTWQDQDDIILIPLDTAMKRTFGYDNIHMIDLQLNNQESVERVTEDVRSILGSRLRIDPEALKEGLQVRNMSEIRDAISSTSRIMSTLLAIIAGISLIVGGIGVMNIMLVSVTERTKEIGLRKALGATGVDIMGQFLVESVFLALLGGLSGIALGWGVALIAAKATGWNFIVSFSSIFMVATVTMLVGIVFGLWPAFKASKLEPIKALKHE